VFKSLLISLDWKLADATPRKILIDSGFVRGLRHALGWDKPYDPSLFDLHPSLGNMDHACRYINDLQAQSFSAGTGFEGCNFDLSLFIQVAEVPFSGAKLLVQKDLEVSDDNHYVCCAETHRLDDGTLFFLIICMYPVMSGYLMQSKFLSIDTSFKWVHDKWQEFEIETWDDIHMRCKNI